MLTLLGMLLGVVGASGQDALTLQLSSPKRAVLVGEPVKLELRLKALKELEEVDLDGEDIPIPLVKVLVDDGAGVKTYVENPDGIEERVRAARRLQAGEERIMNLVLFNGGYVDSTQRTTRAGFVFPKPGRFLIRLSYISLRHRVTSNELQFEVAAPGADDREILDAASREPMILGARGDRTTRATLKLLMDKFPRSPYLKWARLRLLQYRTEAPDSDLDPQVKAHLMMHDRAGLDAQRRRTYEELVEALLRPTVEWEEFEEEALAAGILAAQGAGDKRSAASAKALLHEKYPQSPTARRLRVNRG